MMEAQIKEELSLHLFSAMAARAGYHALIPRIDTGEDLLLSGSEKLPSRNNFTPGGRLIGFQLKATTEKQVTVDKGLLEYDLRAKNFDDMVFRKNLILANPRDISPLLLVLLVLPDDPTLWFQVDFSRRNYSLNGMFYWYLPAETEDYSTNNKTQRIFIPVENVVGLDFFDFSYNLLFKN